MKIVKVKTNEELSKQAADIVEETVTSNVQPVLGLATGSTPEQMYEILQEKYRNNELSFKDVITFNLDEYVGLGKTHPGSYEYYMDTKLFNGIDIQQKNIHMLNGLTTDFAKETAAFEEEITKAGNIDLQILGIGQNGHIGFNEPGTPVDSRTHVVELRENTREVNSRFFNDIEEVPTHALTMGIGTIMAAKKIVLLVQGEKKADILQKVVHGEVTPEVPGSFLQLHEDATIITDIDV